MKKKIALEGIISLLILLYLYTGLTQLLSFNTFHRNILNQPIYEWSKPMLAYAIPVVQLLIVGGLLFERSRQMALWASFGLLIIFTTYISLILLNAFSHVPCNCAGVINTFTWPQHLVFNLTFLLLNGIALVMRKRSQQQSTQAGMVAY